MTISTNKRRAGPFTGTGTPVDYPFGFKVFDAGDIGAYVSDTDGNERRLIYRIEYNITLNADQENNPGGVLRLTSALETGHLLSIISEMPVTQPTEFTNSGGFYPRTLNDSLDRLTIYIQQLAEMLNRTITAGVNTSTTISMPSPMPERFLFWDENRKLSNLDISKLTNDELSGDDKKLATTKAIKSAKELIDTANGQLSSLKDEIDDLRSLLNASGGAIPISFVQRVEAVEQSVQSAITSAASALSKAGGVETSLQFVSNTASAALPRKGGTLTGGLTIETSANGGFSDGLNIKNKGGGAGAATYIDMYLHDTCNASIHAIDTGDGGCELRLMNTTPGAPTTDRRENALRLDQHGNAWIRSYGWLHEHFINNNDLYHNYFPTHYNGSEVWWHKRLTLKVCLINITAQPNQFMPGNGLPHELYLPSVMTGNCIIHGVCHYGNSRTYNLIVGRKESNQMGKINGFGSHSATAYATIIAMGYSDQ